MDLASCKNPVLPFGSCTNPHFRKPDKVSLGLMYVAYLTDIPQHGGMSAGVLTILDALFPRLPQGMRLATAEQADAEVKRLLVPLCTTNALNGYFDVTSALAIKACARVNVDIKAFPIPLFEWHQMSEDDKTTVCGVLHDMCSRRVRTALMKEILLSIATSFSAAVTERGEISDQGKVRLISEVEDAVKVRIRVDRVEINEIWNVYAASTGLYPRDIVECFARFDDIFCPFVSRRLLQCVVQAEGGGALTPLLSLIRAMRRLNTFPWNIAFGMVGQNELANATSAINQYVNDPYLLYRANIDQYAATNYSNLSYLGVQLCLRKLYDGRIVNYRGFAVNGLGVPMRVEIDAIIDDYMRAGARNAQVMNRGGHRRSRG